MNKKKEFRNFHVSNVELTIPSSVSDYLEMSNENMIESYIFIGSKYCLKSGDRVLDFGVGHGISSALMTKWIGKNGLIHSFDSNEEFLKSANEIAKMNNLENNIEFHNIKVFNSSTTKNNEEDIQLEKITIGTTNQSIEDFCEKNNIIPNCIKIDFPGNEFIIIKNLENLIRCNLPSIIIKTYPSKFNSEILLLNIWNILSSSNYFMFDIINGNIIDKNEFLISNSNKISYLLISTKLSENEYLRHLRENLVLEIRQIKQDNRKQINMFEIRDLASSKKYSEIIEKLSSVSPIHLDGEAQYYLAFSLQMTNQDDSKVLSMYELALRGGFDPFWIYYNRGALYKKMGKFRHAHDDLKRAYDLDSRHEGVQTLLDSLR